MYDIEFKLRIIKFKQGCFLLHWGSSGLFFKIICKVCGFFKSKTVSNFGDIPVGMSE